MKFEFSPHIAVPVREYERAVEFYKGLMGLDVAYSDGNETEFRCGETSLHVENNAGGRIFFEFKVDDLEAAKQQLVEAGCKAVAAAAPDGPKSYQITDPYGLSFHLWEG
ncbi:MAG: VOC family protein [candidate division Zixibacteria bacterium]|nr:VOC family protein [candidate division Zixibacteria bacterium]